MSGPPNLLLASFLLRCVPAGIQAVQASSALPVHLQVDGDVWLSDIQVPCLAVFEGGGQWTPMTTSAECLKNI